MSENPIRLGRLALIDARDDLTSLHAVAHVHAQIHDPADHLGARGDPEEPQVVVVGVRVVLLHGGDELERAVRVGTEQLGEARTTDQLYDIVMADASAYYEHRPDSQKIHDLRRRAMRLESRER